MAEVQLPEVLESSSGVIVERDVLMYRQKEIFTVRTTTNARYPLNLSREQLIHLVTFAHEFLSRYPDA